MRGMGKWIVLALAVVAVLACARDPVFWHRYFLAISGSSASLYQPRELVAGGNEAPAPRVAPQLESLDPASLQSAADYAADKNSTALIVSRHDHIVFEKYWHGTGFDTVEDGQSLSRVVVALAAGVAVAQRQIHWPDEPIGHFIAQWKDDPRGAITLNQLLKMSSGLSAPEPSLVPWKASVRGALGSDIDAVHLAAPLVGKPGATWADQSADPQLAALVIERATGMRYAQFVSQALWRPIGAGDAWMWLDREGGTAHADCCMLARQGDWIRLAELLIKDGNYRGDEIIRPGWVARMLVPAHGNENYGSYIRLGKNTVAATEPYAVDDVFVIAGQGGNRLWVVPSMQIAILRMAPESRDAVDFDATRIPNLVIRGAHDYQPPRARPGADISKLVPGH